MKKQAAPRQTMWILIVAGAVMFLMSCVGISGIVGFLAWRGSMARPPQAMNSSVVVTTPAPPPLVPAVPPAENAPRIVDEPLPKIPFRTVKPIPPFDPVPPAPQITFVHEMRGHRGALFAGALTRDGKTAITGGEDNTIRIWNAALGKEEAFFAGHKAPIRDLAISPDGKTVASAAEDGTIRLWDLEQRAPGIVISGHRGKVFAVAFSPDGTRIYSGGEDRSLRAWNTTTGRQLSERYGHDGPVLAVAISRDGKRGLTGSADQGAMLWDLEKGQEICYVIANRAVSDVAFLADQRRGILAADETCYLWDMAEAGRWVGPAGRVSPLLSATMLPGDRILLAGVDDGTFEAVAVPVRPLGFSEQGLPLLFSQKAHTGAVHRVRASGDGRLALTCGADGVAKLWRIGQSILPARVLRGHTSHVRRLALSPDGKLFISSGWDNKAVVWDLETGNSVATLTGAGHRNVNCAAFLPDNRRVLTVSGLDHVVRCWDISTSKELWHGNEHTKDIDYVVVAPNGKQALTVSKDKTFRIWDIEAGKHLRSFPGHGAELSSAVYTSDGRQILTCGSNELRLWDAQSGNEIHRMAGGGFEARISPDDRYVIGGLGNAACLWELATGTKLRTFEGHTGVVYGVDLSADGKRALTASQDGTVRLWDVQTGRELQRFNGHTGLVWCARFTRDGKYALSSGEDQTIRLWPLPQP